ncbi:MAG: hypothetical protein ACOX8A_12390 [Thermacetogeniaceae bacterium]|jgi:hypothetical protein
MAEKGLASVAQAYQLVVEKYGKVPEPDVQEVVSILVIGMDVFLLFRVIPIRLISRA